jgi:putative FmdB family regulatory protein
VPTYQYACTSCGRQLEAVQSFSDAALTECPECPGRLRKLYSAVGIVFKGSGFYRNDSRTSSKPEAAPAAATSSNSTDSTSKPSTSGSGSGSGDGPSVSSGSSRSDSGSTSPAKPADAGKKPAGTGTSAR